MVTLLSIALSIMSNRCLTEKDIEDITRWREDMNLCSSGKTRTISHSFAALTREILFLPREHKIHIFELTCNVLFIT